MSDLPVDLTKVLAELEASKKSLHHRLDSIDAAIQSIHGLQAAHDRPLRDTQVTDFVLVDLPEEFLRENIAAEPMAEAVADAVNEMPEREPTGAVYVASELQTTPAPEPRGRVFQSDSPRTSLIEKEKTLRRPILKPTQDVRKAAQLNVYVNKNSDWASRQIVGPKSRRANFRHKTGQRCPKCGSQDTRLSVTKGIADCLMFLFDYSLARCRNCDTKFRVWRAREEDESEGEQNLEPRPSTE